MNTKLATIAAVALLPFAVHAEESPKVSGYQLKNRSSFSAADDTRAPFWPIGWSRRVAQATPATAAAPVVAKTTIDPNHYKITSILLGSPSLAVINGRAYGEGEFLKAPRGKDAAVAVQPPLRICVQRITEISVVLQHGEEQVTVPFLRAGIAAKGPGRDLLLEDR